MNFIYNHKVSKYLLIKLILVFVILSLPSCGGGRSGETPAGAGTSQLSMTVHTHSLDGGTTDQDYDITLESGFFYLSHLSVSGGGEEEEEHEHTHTCTTFHQHHHEEESGGGAEFHETFKINLMDKETDLGFTPADPGTYTTISFMIHPPHDQSKESLHEEGEVSLFLEGIAEKDGVEYPFHVELLIEDQMTADGLEITFEKGKYTRLKLGFEADTWLNGVDFASAEVEEGEIHINGEENTQLAEQILHNIKHSFEVKTL